MGYDRNSNLSELGSRIENIFKTMTVSIPSMQFQAYAYKLIPLQYTVPDGYEVICAVSYYLSGSTCANVMAYSSSVVIISNVADSVQNIACNVTLLLAKK